jgi:signal transduction histidine kinase/CheY-like chemotaxis protein
MSSEWWNEGFRQQYSVIKQFCIILTSIALSVRVIIAILVSFEAAFGNSQLFIMLASMTGVSILSYLENSSLCVKRVYFFALMQFFSANSRYLSLEIAPKAVIPLCIHSTVLLLLFESYVFKNSISMIFLMIKHIFLWVLIDFENFSINKDFNGKEAIVGMTSLVAILLSYYFESHKRKNLREKHESTEKCQAAHDQLLQILKAFPDGLVIFDEDFKIKFQNDSISEFLNGEKCSLPEKLYRFKVGQNQVSVLEMVKEFLEDKIKSFDSFGVSCVDGNQVEWRGHKIAWEGQSCVMLSLRDVSQILEFERVSAEIKSKNLIIRSISHEFRTPINCINLIIDEILPVVESDIKEKIRIIKTNTELLLFQINDILDYSDLTSNRFLSYDFEVNLKEELQHCIELIKYQSQYKGLKSIIKIDPLIPDKLFLDSYRIQKLVVNLLSNALKYTPHGSIELFAINKGKSINIGVKDTGIGIPQERLNHIQEMFKDFSHSSLSGLGLQVCKKVLEKFGSSLKVDSQAGKGSTFSFDLPIDLNTSQINTNEQVSHEEIDAPVESFSSTSIRNMNIRIFESEMAQVMVVDDHEFNRMCLTNVLKAEGIMFVEANDGKVAVDKVVLHDQVKKPIKVIIMDLNMPVMDGWEASRVIQLLYSQGKISYFPAIIGYTAFSQQDDVRRCYDSGMVHYLQKPSPKNEIVRIVKQFLKSGG